MSLSLVGGSSFNEEPVSMRPLQRELVTRVLEGLGDRTQAWLAQEVGISQKHLSHLMNGRQGGSLDAWERLLKAVSQ